MNKNIIIVILAIIIIAIVGAFVFTQPQTTTDGKLNTQVTFLSGTTLKNGEQVQFELKDLSGNAVAGEEVTISYEEKEGEIQNYTIITDSQGKGYLTLNGESVGDHKITIKYNGSDKYNGCTAEQTIKIEDGTATADTQTSQNSTASTVEYNNESQTQSASTATQTYYDAELNVYYDANGNVIGGQSDGSKIWDLRNNGPVIDENGSLV